MPYAGDFRDLLTAPEFRQEMRSLLRQLRVTKFDSQILEARCTEALVRILEENEDEIVEAFHRYWKRKYPDLIFDYDLNMYAVKLNFGPE